MALIERETLAKEMCKVICGEERNLCVSLPQNCCQQCMKPLFSVPTIDPIKAAGGCRCSECKHRNTCDHTIRIVPGGPGKGCLHGNLHGCEYGVVGKPMEAQDDG